MKPTGSDAPIVEDTTKPQEDVDEAFKQTVTRAITKVVVEETIEKPTMDDQNKTFRTRYAPPLHVFPFHTDKQSNTG
jgi:chitin synthase